MRRKWIWRALTMVLCVVAMTCLWSSAMAGKDEVCENCGSENGNGVYRDCGELHVFVCFDCGYSNEPVPHTLNCECHDWLYEPNGSACRAYCKNCRQKGTEKKHVVLCGVELTKCTHCDADISGLSKSKYEQIHLYINRTCACGDVVKRAATPSSDFLYTKEEEWSSETYTYQEVVYITKYTGSDTVVVIPEEIDGCPVRRIGNRRYCTFNDGVEYVIIPESVNYVDWYAFQNNSTLKSVAMPEKCDLGYCVFQSCSALTQVYLPDSVELDGSSIFNDCSSLEYIHLPATCTSLENSFSFCSALEDIIIPSGVDTLTKDEFMGCTSLKSITIPNSVTTITGNPFRGCTSLTEIRVAEDHPTLEVVDGVLFDKVNKALITYPCAFDDEYYEVPYGTKTIADGAFDAGHQTYSGSNWGEELNEKDRLVAVELPDTISEIGGSAFKGRHYLEEINIPEGITEIQYSTFEQCVALERIVLPDSVTEIEASAFAYCSGLKSVEYPSELVNMGSMAFAHCTSLTRVVIPYGMTTLSDQYAGCHSIIEVEIPDSVTAIYGAFQGWYDIERIVIPNSVQELKTYAFCACDSLKVLYLPESVTRIEQWAILNNPALERLFIPDSVVEIEKEAIKDCDAVTIYCIEGSVAWQYAKENDIPVQVVER